VVDKGKAPVWSKMPNFADSLRESIPTVMRALAQASNSGVLFIRGRDSEAQIMLYRGDILWARSSTTKRIGEALEQRGAISARDLEGVLALQKRKKQRQPIGTILIELGLVDRQVAETEIEAQVISVLRDALDWGSGEYNFEAIEVKSGVSPRFALPSCGKVDSLLQGLGISV
jgi:hypothetical protein